jgi:hypothetical protein
MAPALRALFSTALIAGSKRLELPTFSMPAITVTAIDPISWISRGNLGDDRVDAAGRGRLALARFATCEPLVPATTTIKC